MQPRPIFGQVNKARYHETETWVKRNGQWQVIAEQVLRYYEDPAPGQGTSADIRDISACTSSGLE